MIPDRQQRRKLRRRFGSRWGLLGLGGILLWGCAGTGGSPGDSLLRGGDLAGAIAAYRASVVTQPEDARLRRNLGAALLQAGQLEEATAELETAIALDPADASAIYFLGRAADESGRADLAVSRYTEYLATGAHQAKWVRARIHVLGMERALADVRSALQRERELSLDRVPENSVAVPPFVNIAGSADLEALSRGLAALLITDLSQVAELRIVEREKIQVLQRELSLSAPAQKRTSPTEFDPLDSILGIQQRLQVLMVPGTGHAYFQGTANGTKSVSYLEAVRDFQNDQHLTADGIAGPKTRSALEAALAETAADLDDDGPATLPAGLMDPKTVPRAGRILGAHRFVQGGFLPIGDRDVQLDASILGVADGLTQAAGSPITGELHRVMRLEKELLFSVLQALGVELDAATRSRLGQTATDNFLAFMAYGRGLLLEEEGRAGEALDAYRDAVRNDPGFEMARLREDILSATPADRDQADQAAIGAGATSKRDPIDRLLLTGTWGGVGPGPATDRDDNLYPTTTPSGKVEGGGLIIVEGDLPDRRGPR